MEAVIISVVVLLVLGVVGVFLFFFFRARGLRITLVEYERIAVFRDTGEFLEIRGPGEIFVRNRSLFSRRGEQVRNQYGNAVLGLVYDADKFDLRERAQTLGDEHCITIDSAVVNITPAIVYQITDPEKLVLNVQNHFDALGSAINSTLRASVGTMTLTDVITGRDSIAEAMRIGLQEQASRWGITILSLEIQDIKPAPEVEKAMNERRAAEEESERERQQTVVQAQARQQGAEMDNRTAIALAEANKQTQITDAEAQKIAAITIAEGQKEAEILRADGVASLYRMLMDLGTGADIALRYEQIQALRNLSDSPNSKLVIVPADMGALRDVRDVPYIESVF